MSRPPSNRSEPWAVSPGSPPSPLFARGQINYLFLARQEDQEEEEEEEAKPFPPICTSPSGYSVVLYPPSSFLTATIGLSSTHTKVEEHSVPPSHTFPIFGWGRERGGEEIHCMNLESLPSPLLSSSTLWPPKPPLLQSSGREGKSEERGE